MPSCCSHVVGLAMKSTGPHREHGESEEQHREKSDYVCAVILGSLPAVLRDYSRFSAGDPGLFGGVISGLGFHLGQPLGRQAPLYVLLGPEPDLTPKRRC